nr:leucine-rich repeat domain-containing protein [Leyella stercorea]
MKDVDITAIPASAFAKTSLRFIEFPAQLKTIGEKAFYERSLVGRLVLPESLDSIYSYAFYKNFLTEVIIPANVKYIGGYAFNDNDRLTSVTLGCGLTEISNYCFNSCEKLAVVKGGENVKTIESGAFNYCSELRSVSDLAPVTVGGSAFYCCKKLENFNFSNAKTLKSEAYRECNTLTDVDLTTVETIGTRCFITCTGLKKVVLGNNISRINEYAFTDCNALEELHIGSSVSNLDSRCFYTTSSSLKKVYVTAPAPPSVYNNTSYYPFYSTSGVTLYVPEYAMVSYKLDNYWSKFTKVEPNPNHPDKVNLYKKLELTSNARIPNSPDIYIGKGGSLIVNGDNAQAFGKYTQYMNIGETSSSLISRCKEMTSTSSQFDFFIGATSGYGYWYYLCMPFDVKRSDIILPEGTAIAVRYYDSESRATNGVGGNWKDVSADAVLQTGKGYIFRSSKEGDVGFPATGETHNAIFRSEAITTPLVEYAAEESANAGWNLVGNPYPCFYDIYYMDFAAPITTWDVDNRTYKAYSATDDNFVLTPLQAFFVQKPSLVEAITFQPAGRQINKTIDHSALAMRRAARSKQVQRKLVDVALTCTDRTDRTRVVVNANASDDFCADNDAVKMMAYEGTPQIYTIAGADQLAVNEGAHRSGSVALGMYLPADDVYTIAIDRNELGAKLLDYGVEVEMPYTFSAAEGYADDRFTLTFETTTTGINTVATDAKTDDAIYTIDGRRVSNTDKKGIYIQNHKKIVK